MGIDAQTIMAAVHDATSANVLKYAQDISDAMDEFSINTPIRQASFLAQIATESQYFSHVEENLNYSAQALSELFGSHFQGVDVNDYARQPEKIANRVYANRMGNGDEDSGDGWKYRGRGFIQITGKDEYSKCGDGFGIDLVADPDQLLISPFTVRSAGWFWTSLNLNALADNGDVTGITRRINGGLNGLADRQKVYDAACKALGIV